MKKIILYVLPVLLFLFVFAPAAMAADENVSNQAELEAALGSVSSGDTITLTNDITVGSRVDVNVDGVKIDGDGHTVFSSFEKTSNSNNAALGIFSDDVVVMNLTVDGTGGTSLHGINVYVADNLSLEDVTVMNANNAGVIVNGSTVTVNNITTSGNGWGGINVDLGGGVTGPAILTVNGVSSHDEVAHIWVDDITKDVSVVDTNSQYNFEDTGNFRVYTLKPYPRIAEIIAPTAGEVVYGTVTFEAYLDDEDIDPIQWAVREGTCAAGSGNVFGNVGGLTDVADINTSDPSNQTFSFTGDMSSMTPGMYCFVYNPKEDSGESNLRETVEFELIEPIIGPPVDKNECKKDGWMSFNNPSFKNQGDCVSYLMSNDNAKGNKKK